MIAGKYQRRPPLPFAPGTEASGVVIEVDARAASGSGSATRSWRVLDWGGLAEETVAHEVNVFAKPSNVGFVEAIQLAISYPTSAGALTWPMVLDCAEGPDAAGPCAQPAASAWRRSRSGKILGATVIATAGGARKTAFAKAHGADHVIDYSTADFRDEVLKLTGRPRRRSRLRSGGRRGVRPVAALPGGRRPHLPDRLRRRHHPADPGQHPADSRSIAVTGFNYGYYVGWSPHDARFEAGRPHLRPDGAHPRLVRGRALPAACRLAPSASTRRPRRCERCNQGGSVTGRVAHRHVEAAPSQRDLIWRTLFPQAAVGLLLTESALGDIARLDALDACVGHLLPGRRQRDR